MQEVRHCLTVAYTAAQMYKLVNDINSYPQFLPWCDAARVVAEKGGVQRAELQIRKGLLLYSFITDNIVQENSKITMQLVAGPFQHLSGSWQFFDLASQQSQISFDLDFEFTNKVVTMTFGKLFTKINEQLVNAFIERAKVVYG